jgi:TPR repeat protein
MAQFNIGTLYENGHGVAKDQDVATQWYTKAAAQGYALAVAKLAKMGDDTAPAVNKPVPGKAAD